MGQKAVWWERPPELTPSALPAAEAFPFTALTVPHLLPWAVEALTRASVERPGWEAQLLLAQSLGVSRVAVITGSYPPAGGTQLLDFVRLVGARARRVPLAYLRGDQEFYGLPFRVTPAVLVPRPETEMLVDAAIRYFRACKLRDQPFTIADVGTGSGCVPIAVLAHCPQARAIGYDLSRDALALAARNAAANGVAERVRFVQSDLLTAAGAGKYDVIVSNPPYIPTGEVATLQPEVRDYEPALALDGGEDGMACYPGIAADAARALKPGGRLYVEVGMGQAAFVAATLRAGGLHEIEILSDLAGIGRVVAGTRLPG